MYYKSMSCFGLRIEGYELELLTFFLLIAPAALYVMGLWDDKKGRPFVFAGVVFHLLSIGQRWLLIGGIPLSEKHDNISFMALASVLVYLYASRRKGLKDLSLYALPLASGLMMIASAFRTIDTVSPFMQTPWFYAHTFFFFSSYAFWAVAGAAFACYIINSEPDYEDAGYRLLLYGWMLYSASIFAGAIWFYRAYGTYWLWTSKEMWITLAWFYFGMCLHLRMIPALRGKPFAAFGILGFALAMFSYFGVGTVIPSPPSQF